MSSTANHRAPAWFRYGLMALATLMLCSCRATAPSDTTLSQAPAGPNGRLPANFDTRAFDPQVMPVVYQQDSHSPPPAHRMAEYAAGIRPASCPCCPGGSGSPTGCEVGCTACAVDGRLVGPRDEYLCDGGDQGLTVGVREDWTVDGLEQEDTVAHYDTVDGQTVVTPSNQVCIYAPRFGVVRRMIDLHEYKRSDQVEGLDAPLSLAKVDENEKAATSLNQTEPTIGRAEDPATLMRNRDQLGGLARALVIEEIDGSLAPYADLQVIHTGTVSNGEQALLARSSLAAISWTGDQSPHVSINDKQAVAAVRDSQPGIVYHLHDPKKPQLRLIKLASTGTAQPGDEVEFTLRFDNLGSQVMGNVTIMDNLTTRLEYVDGSAKSDLAADFSAELNSAGSMVLRWEITEPLEAGQGGILQFKCRVR